MKTSRIIPAVLILATVAVYVFRSDKRPELAPSSAAASQAPEPAGPETVSGPLSAPATSTSGENTKEERRPYDTGIPNDPRVRHTEAGEHVFIEAIAIAAKLGEPENDSEQDLEQVDLLLSFYRMAFAENPVAADNQSVMAALMGDNPRSLVFFPADHPSLNGEGELVDRWGTPYYFHALSGTRMEIVSPGPDRKLGNDDDLIHTQRNPDDFFRGFTEEPPDPTEEE